MNIMKKRVLAAALALALVTGLLAGCGGGGAASGSQDGSAQAGSSADSSGQLMDLTGVEDPCMATAGISGGTTVATVGEFDVTMAQLVYWLNVSIGQLASQYASYGVDLAWDMDVGGRAMADYTLDSALQMAAYYRLVPVLAAQAGVSASQEGLDQIEAAQADLEARLGPELAERYYWLIMATPELYRELFEAGELTALLQEHYYGEGGEDYPNDAAVLAYADSELGYYKVKHILLATVDTATREPLDEAVQAEKRVQAEGLLAQLRAAEDPAALFDELMNEYSEDPGLAANPGGYDAYVGQMYPEFEEASLALNEGEISNIVETEAGYHIILRMPPDLDALREIMVTDLMADRSVAWVKEYGLERAQVLEQLDIPAFWDKALEFQQAVYAQVGPALEKLEGGESASGSQG